MERISVFKLIKKYLIYYIYMLNQLNFNNLDKRRHFKLLDIS